LIKLSTVPTISATTSERFGTSFRMSLS